MKTIKQRAKDLTEAYEFGGTQAERLKKVEADMLALYRDTVREFIGVFEDRLAELKAELEGA